MWDANESGQRDERDNRFHDGKTCEPALRDSSVTTFPRYRAILFDLFDTLVRFDRERLPQLQIGGRTVRSTVGHVHGVLRGWAPEITLEALYAGMG